MIFVCCVYIYSALFLTKEEIASATNTLASYRNGDLAPGQMTDAELWHARRGVYTHRQPCVVYSLVLIVWRM